MRVRICTLHVVVLPPQHARFIHPSGRDCLRLPIPPPHFLFTGLSSQNRTSDLPVPSRTLYQTELYLDRWSEGGDSNSHGPRPSVFKTDMSRLIPSPSDKFQDTLKGFEPFKICFNRTYLLTQKYFAVCVFFKLIIWCADLDSNQECKKPRIYSPLRYQFRSSTHINNSGYTPAVSVHYSLNLWINIPVC